MLNEIKPNFTDERFEKELNANLEVLEIATGLTEWTYSEIKPYLKGTILEIGSGIGRISKKIVQNYPKNKIYLSDIDQKYIEFLKEKFKNNLNIQCIKLDLNNLADFKNLENKFDSGFANHVLEHVKDDVLALNEIYKVLKENGTFVIIVPIHPVLFNSLDISLGHYRRYATKDFVEKIAKTQFKIKKITYMNLPGIIGWYLAGNILKKNTLSKSAIKLYDLGVPFFKFIERNIFRKKIGLAMIVVLEK